MENDAVPKLCVIKFSDAFDLFWRDLAADLQLTLEDRLGAEAVAAPDVAILILAAGGAERDALQWLKDHDPPAGVPCFVAAAESNRRVAMQFIHCGAADYFALPDDVEILRNAVASAAARSIDTSADRASVAGADAFAAIVGESPVLREQVGRAMRLVRHRNANALVLGETGAGKELFARAIHAASPRGGGPFVPVNCSALPDHLVESELFGHERGAFTDAHAAKPGLFEVADGGTLFLDEIGHLPLPGQAKLLRALDDGQIRRVGGTKPRAVDVRILAATNEELEERVQEGTFRKDLYFRLSGVTFRLPPLRNRGDDVILIARALLVRLATEHDLPVPVLTPETGELLRSHAWPGNVRELKNAVERALLLSPPGVLLTEELLPRARPARAGAGPIPFPAALDDITSAAAKATVHWCGGNRAESARRLGISPRRLRRLLAGAEPDEDPEPFPA